MHPTRRSLAVSAAIMLISGVLAGPVAAAAPDNDNRAAAIIVDAVPFEWAGDLAEASAEPGEEFGCNNGGNADRSVWFAWTVPDTGTMRVTIGAGGPSEPESDTNVAIFGPFDAPLEGLPGLDALRWCVNGLGDEFALLEAVDAGHTYLFQLSAVSTSETNASIRIEFEGSGPVHPPNDDMANALVIDALPYSASPSMESATIEDLENLQCNGPWTTVWYAYVPEADGRILVTLPGSDFDASVQVFEDGDTIGCQIGEGGMIVPVLAGHTYLLQVGSQSGSGVNLLVEEGPPVLEAAVTLDAAGTVSRSGLATITGTVTCNQPAHAHVNAHLRQRLTRTALADGFGGASIECGPEPTSFTIVVADEDHAFAPGQAEVSALFFASTDHGQFLEQSTAFQALKLRR